MKTKGFLLTLLVISLTGCKPTTPSISEQTTDSIASQNSDLSMSTSQEVMINPELRLKLLSGLDLTVPGEDEQITMRSDLQEWGNPAAGKGGYVQLGQQVIELDAGELVGILRVNSGGNAVDVYLAVFAPGEASWKMTDAILIDDNSSNAQIINLYSEMETIYVAYTDDSLDTQTQAEVTTLEKNGVFTYIDKQLTRRN